MFEGAVAGILNRLLGKYVQDLDTENLNVGIFSGNVNLTDLKLKPEALYELDLPIDVKIGTIGRVTLQIPWTGLYTQPVVVNIEDVLLLVGPAISNSYFDPEREKRLTRAAKRKILQDLEAESEILKGPQNFFEHLFTAIVNNLQIYVRNVHVRYEDSISSKDGPLACGLCLQSLSIETTNSKWKPSVTPANASTVYQMMRIESLSLYWNPTATALDDVEIANITPMQYYNWKHYMMTGLDKFSMHHEDFEFLLKPVTCKVKVLINRSSEARVPRLLLDAVLQDSALQLSRRQFLSVDNLLASFHRIQLNRKYRHLHPGVPISKDIKKWWRYAYNVVIEQRVRPYTWAAIQRHRACYNKYKQTYKSTLRSPHDTELKLDLQQCEDSLPIVSVVIAREHAKYELLAQEPDRIEVVESEIDWWCDEPEPRVELCVKTERKTLWSHLSSPEKKKVCELIGYVEGAPRDKSKQYIEHKVNLTLANCSLTLMNRNKEVLGVTLTQFLASLETRPSAKAYKLSARAESIVMEGLSSDGELVPLLTAEKGSPTSTNLLAVDVEKNPASSEADYGLCCLMEPVELMYVEHAFTELINFFQTRSMTSDELAAELAARAGRAASAGRAAAAYAVSRRKLFQLSVDVRGPCVLVPERGQPTKTGKLLVVDISRLVVKSELQPSKLALEDATCMELEERLYDRLHAECSCQVLFCSGGGWRAARRQAGSPLHVLPRARAQVVFSNSVQKDYKLLPRYKLNVSLSSLKLNVSQHTIASLLEFAEQLPAPAPAAAPVSFLDSGDHGDAAPAPALLRDRVPAEPARQDLVRLRQRIVAAYLTRERAAESTFDRAGAKLGFQESNQVFISSEHSDEDMEVYARSVDLPGFDDNVSPSNSINTLLRFIVGEIVINLSRTVDKQERPYLLASISKVCLDVALMRYGPALQLCVAAATLVEHTPEGDVEMLSSEGELLSLLYRKVRADCPDFRSHFHSVEQSLVGDAGPLSLVLDARGLPAVLQQLRDISSQIQSRHELNLNKTLLPRSRSLWELLTQPEADPPVPSGATKFSYSVRLASALVRLRQPGALLELRVSGLESDCVFRANDRMIFKLNLAAAHLDDLSGATLYPKLLWPDEERVLELKYVRAAPRFYGRQQLPAHGELRARLGRLQLVLLHSALLQLQQALEALVPARAASAAAGAAERAAGSRARRLRSCGARLNLVVEIHAPVLLLPQKQSSPNLLVLNMGDLQIENLFKQVTPRDAGSAGQGPVLDNVLVQLANVTLARAVMTLAGSLEVQEPILEPVSLRCDLKRAVSFQQYSASHRDLLLCDAHVSMDPVTLNLGHRDLATLRAVWADNLSELRYMDSITPGSPVESQPADISVKKLQEFFAQGEPVRKEAVLRFTLEGVELKLFSDVDEVLSSPVRDPGRGLARLAAGEAALHAEYYSDGSVELRASLQSLLVEDVRRDAGVVIEKVFQSQCYLSTAGVAVWRPALLELSARAARGRGAACDARVDRTRLNLCAPFVLALARALLDHAPGSRSASGGLVNLGYDGERAPGASDCTSGYCSAATSAPEESPGLSISIQFRQPEVMLFTALNKSDGHALLIRTELLIDYSSHCNQDNLVVSLAGFQVISKLQSKLKNLPPQVVLRPCDLEFSKSFKSVDEGVKVNVSVSDIELHLAATTVHTVVDIMEEIQSELTVPDSEAFSFSTTNPKFEKQDEELWAPKKITPSLLVNPDDSYVQPKYPSVKVQETFTMVVPSVRILLEVEQAERVPVFMMKLSGELRLHDWSRRLHGAARVAARAAVLNERLGRWEPVLEPVVCAENRARPWELSATVFQAKSYPMSSRLDTSSQPAAETVADSSKKPRRRTELESETSADEDNTDNEMTFIKNPDGGRRNTGEFSGGNVFLSALDVDSDSENENGLMDKLTSAMGHLFTDDSSAGELSNDSDSSAPEKSEAEAEGSDREADKTVSFIDGEGQEADVTQEPIRQDSVDSGLESESAERLCTYVVIEAREPLRLCAHAALGRALRALSLERAAAVRALAAPAPLALANDIQPGSTVQLKTRAESEPAGAERVLAVADYDADSSRPSTPGDTSSADMLDDAADLKPDTTDASDDWDCVEGGFPAAAARGAAAWRSPQAPVAARLPRRAERTLTVKLRDMDELTIPCPQRTATKLHVLHPSRNGTRYYIVVERTAGYNTQKIVVRSPLQLRNETSYPLELFYKRSDLQAVGAPLVGAVGNPFEDKMRLACVAPQDTYNVPLYIAYHCRLFLMPVHTENYQTSTQGIWWVELAKDLDSPRDIICPAKSDDDSNVFAMRILTVEGCPSPKITRAIPNYLIRVLPPLALYNRLPYALSLSCGAIAARVEPGECTYSHALPPSRSHRLSLSLNYLGLPWTGSFTLSPDMTERNVAMSTERDTQGGNTQLGVRAGLRRADGWQLHLHAPYWLINKTGLPLQLKGSRSDTVLEVTDEPLLWAPARRARGPKLRLRAHQSAWSRAARAAAAPGLVVCAHPERRTSYRILLNVTLSELCPQLTKIVTLLPYFLVYNDTKRHLRFMEENEAADLWIDLAPQQCTPFWPQTDSMAMHCKYRDSGVVSQHFPITKNHFTVLRMDKGTALAVEVTGGTERPFTITFRAYAAGDAPVRVDNLCDDLFIKLHQQDCGQVALLSPYQSMLYTWDDPAKERQLMWHMYNNKGRGYVADFSQDGYGEEKVSVRSVKHSTLVATSSVTSKLSSTLKRLTPKSPEPGSSSSDDSDNEQPDPHKKKMRKDKVIVYWISYMEGLQRVFVLAQDERIAYQYRMRINSEKSDYEVYLSLAEVSLSVCVDTKAGVKELAHLTVMDSLPRWEVNVSHRWKQLSPDLTAWIEDKYQTDQKKCQLKEYLHIDLEKMQMTKPFFSELRRTYIPGVWLQLRKSETLTYCHLKLQRLQLDNQLSEAVFPCVLYPGSVPSHATNRALKPCVELVALKQHRPSLNQDVYKYLKVLVQEYCVNLDRGFVNYVFDILNHWKLEEKPAVRLRADLALVHMPLPIIALKSQSSTQRNVVFEFVHLSPIKLVLSLSSRGYSDPQSPTRARFSSKKENRPKLFNSDLLEYLFNSWGSSLCDMKDVVLRMAYLELRNAPLTVAALLDTASRFYWTQLVQQFYVLVLGLNILGNPYSVIGDFARAMKCYYEPCLGSVSGPRAGDAAGRLEADAARLLRHSAAAPALLPGARPRRAAVEEGTICNDLPAKVVEASRSHPASVALALSGLVARPSFDEDYVILRNVWRSATRGVLARPLGGGAWRVLRACAERAGHRLAARARLPRHCCAAEGIAPYSRHAALGRQLLATLSRGHFADTDGYLAHAPLAPPAALLLTTQHIFMVRASGGGAGWHIEWAIKLDDLIGAPAASGDKLVLNVKQDELVNYFSTDEKVIEIPDPETLHWLRDKIECALALALEDKRCPTE